MMRYGIPGYRTPRDVLDHEIQRILDMGHVEMRLEHPRRQGRLHRAAREGLRRHPLGARLQVRPPLPVPGGDAPNCVTGVAFLEAFNKGRLKSPPPGGRGRRRRYLHRRGLGGAPPRPHHQAQPRRTVPEHGRRWLHRPRRGRTAASRRRRGTLTSLFPIEKMTAAEHEVEDALREGVTSWAASCRSKCRATTERPRHRTEDAPSARW